MSGTKTIKLKARRQRSSVLNTKIIAFKIPINFNLYLIRLPNYFFF